MLSYLVEFTVGAELPDEISLDTKLMEAEETLAETNIGLWLNPSDLKRNDTTYCLMFCTIHK